MEERASLVYNCGLSDYALFTCLEASDIFQARMKIWFKSEKASTFNERDIWNSKHKNKLVIQLLFL